MRSRSAAAYLGIGERKLWELSHLADGSGIPRVLIGRAVRYDVLDLDAWIRRNKTGGEAARRGRHA